MNHWSTAPEWKQLAVIHSLIIYAQFLNQTEELSGKGNKLLQRVNKKQTYHERTDNMIVSVCVWNNKNKK